MPILIGLAGLATFYAVSGKQKVFISYYSKGDSHFKNMIMAWVKNNKFDLNFEDVSTDTNINSEDTAYLRRRMRQQIEKADTFLVFIGRDTHTRDWVAWEIEQAKEFGKRIIAVKESRQCKSPAPLLGAGAIWVYGFSEEGIREALES